MNRERRYGSEAVFGRWTKETYGKLVKETSPPTAWVKNCAMAFLFGGGICALGEGLFLLYGLTGLSEQENRTAVSVTLVALASLLTALRVFDRIGKIAGAGTLVPITGFANAVVSPAMEFKSEGFVLGVGAKMFAVAGPVLVYGVVSSVLYGLILFLVGQFL